MTETIETMDTVEFEGSTWQVSAITEDGYELIGFADVHNYVEFADVHKMTLVSKG
jgi:hypothetical protein